MVLDSSIPQLKTRDDAGLILEDLMKERPEVGAFTKSHDEDFVSELDKLVKQRQKELREKSLGLRVERFDRLALVTEFPQSKLERLLREAKELIAGKEYAQATRPLAEALQEHPGHHEATYLLAYCQSRMKEPEQALKTLLPLRQARLEGALADRVALLMSDIRRQMLLPVMAENLLLLLTGEHGRAVKRLQELVQLDPAAGMYHYLLGGSLMTAGRIEKALEAVENGVRQCAPAERPLLISLQEQIKRRYVAKLMEPARRLYKKQAYKRARSKLKAVPADCRDVRLYQLFDSHLAELQPSGWGPWASKKRPEDLAPPRNLGEVEPLYFFLARDEIKEALRRLEREEFRKAEGLLRRASALAPYFPYANYLYASCVYSRLGQQLMEGSPPPGEELIAVLEDARGHARVGVKDKEIPDAAELLTIIEKTLATVEEARAAAETRRQEVQRVNALIQEFEAIVEKAKDGIGSSLEFEEVYTRMGKLKKRIPGVRRQTQSADGIEALDQLSEAVDRNYRQLEGMRDKVRDSTIVNGYTAKFNLRMMGLQSQGGIRSYSQLQDERAFFRNLKSDIKRDLPSLTSPEARRQMRELLSALDDVLSQLDKV